MKKRHSFHGMDKTDWKLYEIFLIGVLIVAYTFGCWAFGDKFFIVKFWSLLTLLTIYAFFRLQKHIVLFSPLTLFCLFYTTIPLTNFYYIATDFDSAIFLDKTTLRSDYIYLFEMSAFYYWGGLAAMLLGYSVIRKPAFAPIKFESNSKLNPHILNIFIIGMLAIGLANFGYNVLAYAGGNPLRYLSNVAARKEEFESTGGTTLGYHFYYMASYLLFFAFCKSKKSRLAAYPDCIGRCRNTGQHRQDIRYPFLSAFIYWYFLH